MSITHMYQFHGGSDGGLAAALNIQDIATIMTSTFQLGGSSTSSLMGGSHDMFKNLAVPAGLVLSSSAASITDDNDHDNAKTSSIMPEDMFDRMLSLVSDGGKKITPIFTRRFKMRGGSSKTKTRRL